MLKKFSQLIKKINTFFYSFIYRFFSRTDRFIRKFWTFLFVNVIKKFLLPTFQFLVVFNIINGQFEKLVAERKIVTAFNLYGYWMKRGWLPEPKNPALQYPIPMQSLEVRSQIHDDPETINHIQDIVNYGYDRYFSNLSSFVVPLFILGFHEFSVHRHNIRLRSTINEYLKREYDDKGISEGKWSSIDSAHYKYSIFDRLFAMLQYTTIFTISTLKLFSWLKYLNCDKFYIWYFIQSTAGYWVGVEKLFTWIDPFLLNVILDRFQFIFITRNRYNVSYITRYHAAQAFCLDMTLGVFFMLVEFCLKNYKSYLTETATYWVRMLEVSLYFGLLLPIIITAFLAIETKLPILHSAVTFHVGKPPKKDNFEFWTPLKVKKINIGSSLAGKKRDYTFKYRNGLIPIEFIGLIGLIGLFNYATDPLFLIYQEYRYMPLSLGLPIYS